MIQRSESAYLGGKRKRVDGRDVMYIEADSYPQLWIITVVNFDDNLKG